MNEFEINLNHVLVDTFNYILKFEELSLKSISNAPVTVSEAHIIEAIEKLSGKATVSDLANALSIAMPTVTVAVKKLEKKGFVKKTSYEKDARINIIELTDSGERVNRAHELFHRKMVRNIAREFDESEKAVLLDAVKKLSEFFRKKVETK